MRLTLLIYDLYFPHCQSLKDKRRILNGIKDLVRSRLNVSIAEVDFEDKWQRSRLAITWVTGGEENYHQIENDLQSYILNRPGISACQVERREFL